VEVDIISNIFHGKKELCTNIFEGGCFLEKHQQMHYTQSDRCCGQIVKHDAPATVHVAIEPTDGPRFDDIEQAKEHKRDQ